MTNSRVFTTSYQAPGNEEQALRDLVKHIPNAVQAILCPEMLDNIKVCDEAYRELAKAKPSPKM